MQKLTFTVYEVYSHAYPYKDVAEVIHGLRCIWNSRGKNDGAIQLRDQIASDMYRKGVEVYVGIREREIETKAFSFV